nr:RNA chaperone Hfq [Noviherbaspirillum aerium]
MDSGKKDGLQGPYLNDLRKRRMSIVIYLMNGMKQTGVLESFDQHSILLRQGHNLQLVYKHTVATMMPAPKEGLKPKSRPYEAPAAARSEPGSSTVPVIRRKVTRRLVKPEE